MILGLHTSNNSSTAILYFTRNAELEAKRKRLAPKKYSLNKRVVKVLIEHTESIIVSTGLSYFLPDQDNSHLSFGQKLTRSIDQVFSMGYTSLIILGNDCPTLSQEDIYRAANTLNRGSDIYGRATDGGLYLIGLQQESYHKAIFEKLSWSSESLAEDFDNYLSKYSRKLHCIFPTIKADIDNVIDLNNFVESKATHLIIYNTLLSIISIFIGVVGHELSIELSQIRLKSTGLRGPPSLAA